MKNKIQYVTDECGIEMTWRKYFWIIFIILAALLFFGINNVDAANYYIRQGAIGNNSGSDWVNANPNMITGTAFVRGNTYYVADGTYGSVTFSEPVSGTTLVTVKKATIADHGTDTGWSDTYGDGVAEFNGAATTTALWGISTDYWLIDGVTGSGTSGHGFKLTTTTTTVKSYMVTIAGGCDHITLSHCEIEQQGMNSLIARYGIYSNGISSAVRYITISNCYIHDVTIVHMLIRNWQNCVIENNYFEYRNILPGGSHGESMSIGSCGTAAEDTIRFNVFKDILGTGYLAWLDSDQGGFDIYGNVFYTTNSATYLASNGIITNDSGSNNSDMHVYNNTFYNIQGTSSTAVDVVDWSGGTGTGNITKNNLVYGGRTTNLVGTQTADYNASDVPGTNMTGGNNVDLSVDPFVDLSGYNFHIDETDGAPIIGAGVNLGAPYNLDIDGNTRPAEGGWTIGAYGGTGAAVDTTHSVTLTSPDGGEVWGIGKSHNITFSGNSYVDSVIVLVSTNNGSSYVAQDTLLTTVGSFAWTIPNEASVQCFVIIQDKTDNAVADTSAAVFTIAVPLHVTAPDGAEVWRSGDTENITWNAADVPFVKIEYSLDGGSAWWTIVDEGTAAAGTLAWVIPNINSTNCKVKITDTSDGSITDSSDAVFTIQSVTAGTDAVINDINALFRSSE